MSEILNILRNHKETTAWLAALEAAGDPPGAIALPATAELARTLRDLAVAEEDIAELLATVPSPDGTPEVWRLLERCVWSIVGPMGTVGDWPPLPAWPAATGAIGRGFYVWVFLAALPFACAFHRDRGVPEDVSRATLANLGRMVGHGRRESGGAAVAHPWWMALHLRGALYQLGRLQFERSRLGSRTAEAIAAQGVAAAPGDPVLSVHIPGWSGPLDPAECDASFDRAVPFFARHFPEERFELAVCYSWMLDDELAEYLPERANIVRFGRRFRPAYRHGPNDGTILGFVFGRADLPLDAYPQGTTLERAVITHLKAGRHWHGGAGWIRLPARPSS